MGLENEDIFADEPDTSWFDMSDEEKQSLIIKAISYAEQERYRESGESSRRRESRASDCIAMEEDLRGIFASLGVPATSQWARAINLARGVPSEQSFGHVFILVGAEEKPEFIVDPTFCQFMAVDGRVYDSSKGIISSISQDNPVIQELQRSGFFAWTDGDYQVYLSALTSDQVTPPPADIDRSAFKRARVLGE